MAQKVNYRDILMLSSKADDIKLASEILKKEDYHFFFIKEAAKFKAALDKKPFKTIILDHTKAFDALEWLVENKDDFSHDETGIPSFLVLLAPDELTLIPRVTALGADYALKPVNAEEFSFRVGRMVRMNRVEGRLIEEIKGRKSAEKKIDAAYMAMDIIRKTDPLTQMSNRRTLEEKIEYEQVKTLRTGRDFCLVLVDILKLKSINDTNGYDCGDYIIKEVANLIADVIRKQDSMGRWDSDQFMILCPETPETGANVMINRLMEAMDEKTFLFEGSMVDVKLQTLIQVCSGDENMDTYYNMLEERMKGAKE